MPKSDPGEHSAGPVRLIVCVDDFGLNSGVDRSVLALAALGRISATSALVDAPLWPADAGRLFDLPRPIDVGLHLNLTEGFEGSPSLPEWRALVLKAYSGRLDKAWVRQELERQFDRFWAVAQRPPDFVDGHRHVHQLPVVRGALLESLRERGWRPWLRSTRPARAAQAFTGDRLKGQVIAGLGGPGWRRLLQAQGHAHNARLLGVYGFAGSPSDHATRLAAWVAAARGGDLLMCHTALPGAQGAADPIASARSLEHALLAGDRFGELLARYGVRIERGATSLRWG